jgi:hypothetical protein
VICELKEGTWQQGRVRRAEDTEMCKKLERNVGERREEGKGMKGRKRVRD